MFKKSIYGLLILLALLVLGFVLNHLGNIQDRNLKAIDAVTSRASVILKFSDMNRLSGELSGSSIIWQELKQKSFFSLFDRVASSLSEQLADNKTKSSIISDDGILAFGNLNAQREFLLSLPYNSKMSQKQLLEVLVQVEEIQRLEIKDDISQFQFEGASLYLSIYGNLLLVSNNSSFLEEGLLALEENAGILNDPLFERVYRSAGNYADANLFIQHEKVGQFFEGFLREGQEMPLLLGDFAGWSEMDLSVQANSFMLNGFSHCADSTSSFLNVFEGQEVQAIQLTACLPENTLSFEFRGLSDIDLYLSHWREHLRKKGEWDFYQGELDQAQKELAFDPQQSFYSWLGSEMAVAHYGSGTDEKQLLVLKASDLFSAQNALGKLLREDSNEGEVKELALKGLLPLLFGKDFVSGDMNYFTTLDDYILFSSSAEELKKLREDFGQGKNLQNSEEFVSYSTKQLSPETNLLIYQRPGMIRGIGEELFQAELKEEIVESRELFRKFPAFSCQYEFRENGFFYGNLFLNYSTGQGGKRADSPKELLWELNLGEKLIAGPFMMLNHYTQDYEILVQDSSLNLSLISAAGNVLWSKKLKEPIIGSVEQVDLYKNRKLQMVFVTPSKLHMLDRKGRKVEKYPVKLKSKAIAGISVSDYENRRDYRLLVSCKDHKVYNFDAYGKPIKGWSSVSSEGKWLKSPEHLGLSGKDYLFSYDDKGIIYLLDRKGKKRHTVKQIIANASANAFHLEKGERIESSTLIYSDTLGNVVRLGLDGEKEKLYLSSELSTNHRFHVLGKGKSKSHYLLSDDKGLKLFGPDRKKAWNFELEKASGNCALMEQVKEANWYIAASAENRIVILDKSGELISDRYYQSFHSFHLADLHRDGGVDLILFTQEGEIQVFHIR